MRFEVFGIDRDSNAQCFHAVQEFEDMQAAKAWCAHESWSGIWYHAEPVNLTKADICDMLGVTMLQVENAMYSGQLPPPRGEDGTWEFKHVSFFVEAWRESILRKHKKLSTTTVNGTYPVHTR
jgi:hypothetical protein